MISVKITDEQRQYAGELAQSIIAYDKLKGFKDKTIGCHNYTHNLGLLGEVIFADFLDLPRPKNLEANDKGVDFQIGENKIDIKTKSFSFGPNLDLIIYESDLDKLTTHWFMLNIIGNEAFFVGSISKKKLMAVCERKDYGFGPRLAVHYSLLTEFEGVLE